MIDDANRLLTIVATRGLRGPGPESNWWGMAAEATRRPYIETPAGDIPGHVVLDLTRAGYVAASLLPEAEQMPGGDDLDRITHRYTITPAGRAYLSSLPERTTR